MIILIISFYLIAFVLLILVGTFSAIKYFGAGEFFKQMLCKHEWGPHKECGGRYKYSGCWIDCCVKQCIKCEEIKECF